MTGIVPTREEPKASRGVPEAVAKPQLAEGEIGVSDGDRTRDSRIHNPELYH